MFATALLKIHEKDGNKHKPRDLVEWSTVFYMNPTHFIQSSCSTYFLMFSAVVFFALQIKRAFTKMTKLCVSKQSSLWVILAGVA